MFGLAFIPDCEIAADMSVCFTGNFANQGHSSGTDFHRGCGGIHRFLWHQDGGVAWSGFFFFQATDENDAHSIKEDE
jgi:hypothetical protein